MGRYTLTVEIEAANLANAMGVASRIPATFAYNTINDSWRGILSYDLSEHDEDRGVFLRIQPTPDIIETQL